MDSKHSAYTQIHICSVGRQKVKKEQEGKGKKKSKNIHHMFLITLIIKNKRSNMNNSRNDHATFCKSSVGVVFLLKEIP